LPFGLVLVGFCFGGVGGVVVVRVFVWGVLVVVVVVVVVGVVVGGVVGVVWVGVLILLDVDVEMMVVVF
jgi:hypothetical protein